MSERDSLDLAVAALRSRLPSPSCPMCKGGSFSIGQLRLTPEPPSFPLDLVVMTCAGCGFTSFHDQQVLGVA